MLHIEPLGDRALLVRLGEAIDDATHRRVLAAVARLTPQELPGALEVVPAFTTLAVHYDPVRIGYDALAALIEPKLRELERAALPAPRLVEIPVQYGGRDGPDLEHVARHTGLSTDEVIALHTAGEYRVHMIGFSPGFPYLGGLDPRLHCPRRESPRTHVPAGSVGIGGAQTGVYPTETPGGWNIIGRTRLALFDAWRSPAALLGAGDLVRFVAIEPGP